MKRRKMVKNIGNKTYQLNGEINHSNHDTYSSFKR